MRSWSGSGTHASGATLPCLRKTPHEIVAKALVGDYRPEHLFTLKQSLDGYRFYKKLITELDEETARLMQAVPSAGSSWRRCPRAPSIPSTSATAMIHASIFAVSSTASRASI